MNKDIPILKQSIIEQHKVESDGKIIKQIGDFKMGTFVIEGEYDLVKVAAGYASQCHKKTNHNYNGLPYTTHLNIVYEYGLKYQHLLPESEREFALAACWTHDVIEDCRQTYNDVKNILGEDVAGITYALTNEKGRNRKERANEKYYNGIRESITATFVKICDRLANIKYSVDTKSSMLNAYRKEQDNFYQWMCIDQFREMFDEYNQLLTVV